MASFSPPPPPPPSPLDPFHPAHPSKGTTLDRFLHLLTARVASSTQQAKSLLHFCDPLEAVTELLFPAAECLAQMPRRNGGHLEISAAHHILRSGLDLTLRRLPAAADVKRSLLVVTAPGESDELGADIIARTAESCGWTSYFAGANVSHEELLFAIARLSPDVLVIHASGEASLPGVQILIGRLQRAAVWPAVQLAICSGVLQETPRQRLMLAEPLPLPDIVAADPVELLEMLQLCPHFRMSEHRAPGHVAHPPLSMAKPWRCDEEAWAVLQRRLYPPPPRAQGA